jgi:transcriptional regulator with XRE-family HTH domain
VQKSIHTAAYAIFLELLIETRTRAGITQKQQLGNELPFEQPSISKMERGERRVDLIEMRLICEKLGTTLGEFVKELERRLGDQRNA